MDAAALWQRYQDWLYHEGLEFYLDVSRMRFDDAFVEALQPKFDFQDMAALEGGAIAPMKTMVGHYWLRNQELTRDIVQTLEQIEAFTKSSWCDSSSQAPLPTFFHWHWWFSLGPQFVAEALPHSL